MELFSCYKKTLMVVCCTAICSATLAYTPLSYQNASSSHTSQQERELGAQFIRMIQKNLPILSDPIVNDYIQNLGFKLVSYSSKPSKHYQFFVIRDPGINAFAGPDGYIGINAGLILKAQSESELAAVIAHELAHSTQKHLMQSIAKQKKLQIASIVAMLAAAVVATQSPEAGTGLLASATAGSYQYFFNYSREYEKDADRIGIQILSDAGFNPEGMPSLLRLMLKEDRLNDLGFSEYLRTHPVTESRLADVNSRVANLPKKKYIDRTEFRLIQARVAVDLSSSKPQKLMRQLQLKKNSIGAQYAYTLAAMVAGQYKIAENTINKLIKKRPAQLLFKMTLAEIQAKNNQIKSAQNTYARIYKYNSDYYPLLMQYGYFLLTNSKAKQAMKMLEEHVGDYSNDTRYLALLSRAQGKSKNLVHAYQTRAKIYILTGNKKAAVQQLKLALQFAKHDAYISTLIKAKIKELSGK